MSPTLPPPALPATYRQRHDGWTPARQAEFIRCLADGHSVEAACARVGMARSAAYRLRQHPDAEDFREAWAAAVQVAWAQLAEQALFRALNGEVVTHSRWVNGELITVERHQPCSPRLLIALLARADRRAEAGAAEQLPADRHGLLALHNILNEFPDRAGWDAEPDAAALASPAPAPLLPMADVPLCPRSVLLPTRARRARVADPDRPRQPRSPPRKPRPDPAAEAEANAMARLAAFEQAIGLNPAGPAHAPSRTHAHTHKRARTRACVARECPLCLVPNFS